MTQEILLSKLRLKISPTMNGTSCTEGKRKAVASCYKVSTTIRVTTSMTKIQVIGMDARTPRAVVTVKTKLCEAAVEVDVASTSSIKTITTTTSKAGVVARLRIITSKSRKADLAGAPIHNTLVALDKVKFTLTVRLKAGNNTSNMQTAHTMTNRKLLSRIAISAP